MAKQKRGLGRGLDSFIAGGVSMPDPVEKAEGKASIKSAPSFKTVIKDGVGAPAANTGYRDMSIDAIAPNPFQPRRDFNEVHLRELAESIRSEGLLQPIVVRKDGEKYQLIAGERRWRACRQLNLKTIPVRIVDASDASSATISLIENLQREGLNPIEEAIGFASLLRDFDLTQDQVGERVGKGRATVANALRLLQLEKEVQGYIRKGHLSRGHAKVLLSIEDEAQRTVLARRIVELGSSVRETERLAKQVKENRGQTAAKAGASKSPAEEAAVSELEDKISKRFKTRVILKHAPRKGRIIIEYFGNDDLARILEEMGVES